MESKAGVQISQKAFIQSAMILLILMVVAGLLTRVVPAGTYTRHTVSGREVIDPDSFRLVARPDYPVWRWFTAPLEVLGGPDNLTIIGIVLFILMVGSAFAVLDQGGILEAIVARIVTAFESRKYLLLLIVSFTFMAVGAFFGLFEEIVPLVPLMIALSYSLGWDSLVGLGMSILATNMGFSAAVTNPFTIVVAQEIAELPPYSGAPLRLLIFAVIYAVFALFLTTYARRVERDPQRSPVFEEDRLGRTRYQSIHVNVPPAQARRTSRAIGWFLAFFALIVLTIVSGALIEPLGDYTVLIVGLWFLVGGIGAGLMAGLGGRAVLRALGQGLAGIGPGIPLILMAASVKHIVAAGGVIDTILHGAANLLSGTGPFVAALLIYVLALLIEFFVASGSAKAFLLMPILIPLADLVGVTRQVAVTAYCFGDGFSNLAYPTNPVLLISLGLTVVSYAKWLKWTLRLWFWVALVTVLFLGLGVAINYGPF